MRTTEFVFGPPPPSDLDVTLSAAQIERYAQSGLVRVDRLTTDEELEWLAAVMAEVMDGGTSFVFEPGRSLAEEGPFKIAQSIHPEIQFPELLETTFCRNARRIAASLLGVTADAPSAWGYMLRMPTSTGREVPWHQDEAYWEPELEYDAVGAWLSLHDATAERGALRFVPGSHHGGVVHHDELGNLPESLLVATGVDESQAITCEVPAGGATFHHHRTLVSARPNTSAEVAEAYVTEFQTPPKRRATTRRWPWTDHRREGMGDLGDPCIYVANGRIVTLP